MEADIRSTDQYVAAEALYAAFWSPGSQTLHAAQQVDSAGADVWFIGSSMPGPLQAGPRTGAYTIGGDGTLRLRTPDARLLKVSTDKRLVSVVVPRGEGEDVVERRSLDEDAALDDWAAPGRVEQLCWSPDGQRLLLLVAGRSADLSGREGGFALRGASDGPDWLPEVTSSSEGDRWRGLWLWDVSCPAPRRLTHPPFNPWEVGWCGNEDIVVVTSEDHSEGSWFSASLVRMGIADGRRDEVRRPADQLGCPTGSPDGRAIAWIEAVCSDRGLVCGDLMIQAGQGAARCLDTRSTQLTDLAWCDPRRLLFAGLRGLETVVGEIDIESGAVIEHWASIDRTLSGWLPAAVPATSGGALAIVEGYESPPCIAELRDGRIHGRLALGPKTMSDVGSMRAITWSARDGVSLEGLLISPDGSEPRPDAGWPLYVDIHGGPIWAHRCRWAAQLRADPLLARRRWAVLLPNPRGSAGRGQAFARAVVGDMGGADMDDILAGIDHLVATGIADPRRVAAGGTSYGGFLASWLVTQVRVLAAAVPISPVTNWYHQHYASQAPWFDRAFLEASPNVPGGAYYGRSPVFHAEGAVTPTLLLAGGRDKNAPPAQALEFYGALVEAGVPCVLAMYPAGGHSLRGFPEYLDSAARIVMWLDMHVPPRSASD